MIISLTGRATMPLPDYVGFNPVQVRAAAIHRPVKTRRWSRSLGLRRKHHALVVDTRGGWSWAADDAVSPASRFSCIQKWLGEHASSNISLWASGDLLRSLQCVGAAANSDQPGFDSHMRHRLLAEHGTDASEWPMMTWQTAAGRGAYALSGLDLAAVWREAKRHDVRVESIIPWWNHAFETTLRCVSSLRQTKNAAVCVVEGEHIAWIRCTGGAMTQVQQRTLPSPTLAALGDELAKLQCPSVAAAGLPIVVGQGLTDGANTSSLAALVLGRLDGRQPPMWMRSSAQLDFC